MLNEPYPRTQIDGLQDQYSLASGIACDEAEDVTRQEFADEADVNVILRRFGVGNLPPMQPLTFGEVDYDLDLQGAYAAVRDATLAHQNLPEAIRANYPTWEDVYAGMERGELVYQDGRLQVKPTEPSNVQPPPDNAA